MQSFSIPHSTLRVGADARQLWQTLAAIEKSDLAQEVYVRHICVTLQDVYQQASTEGAPVAMCLAQWHEGMLRVVEVEQDWLATQLPEQQSTLFLQARPRKVLRPLTQPSFAYCVCERIRRAAPLARALRRRNVTRQPCASAGVVCRTEVVREAGAR